MCTQCLVNPFYYGEVAPGITLIRARREEEDTMAVKDWGLLRCNDPDIVFQTTPFLYTDKDKLFEKLREFNEEFYCDIELGHIYYEAFSKLKLSFSVKRLFVKYHALSFNDKLYLYLASYIANSNPETDPDPFPNLDQLDSIKKDYTFDPKLP